MEESYLDDNLGRDNISPRLRARKITPLAKMEEICLDYDILDRSSSGSTISPRLRARKIIPLAKMEEICLDDDNLDRDSTSSNISPRLRARKITPLVVLSSDSDRDSPVYLPTDVQDAININSGDIQPIECAVHIKKEIITTDEDRELSENDVIDQVSDDISNVNLNSKNEKPTLVSQSKPSTPEACSSKGEGSGIKKTDKVKENFLKGNTSKPSSTSPRKVKRGAARWSTKYWVHKKIRRPIARRPLLQGQGHTRKYFNTRSEFGKLKKKGHWSQIPMHYDDESNLASDGDKLENKQEQNSQTELKSPCKKSHRSHKKGFGINAGQIKKRGRPRTVPTEGTKRKRGRPRLSENGVSIKRKGSPRLIAKDILKKKGRVKSMDNEDSIKTRQKPKLNKDERKFLKQSAGKMNKVKTFLQNINCLHSEIKLIKCRECRRAACNRSTWDMMNSSCRFLEYRKLLESENGTIVCAGFLQPFESTEDDHSLWLPNVAEPPKDLNSDTAKQLLIQVGDQFCDLVQQEKEALSLHLGAENDMTWKKHVPGVREMCDVCDTTLFNIHWVCPKCGLAVCIDCYKVRKQGIVIEHEESQMRGRDEYLWLFCHNRISHDLETLVMAQMVPGDVLWTVSDSMHKAREKWNIEAYCKCIPQESIGVDKKSVHTGICKQVMCNVSSSFATIIVNDRHPALEDISFSNIDIPSRATKWLPFEYGVGPPFEKPMRETFNSETDRTIPYMTYEMFQSVEDAFPKDNGGDCIDGLKSLTISEMKECILMSQGKKRSDRRTEAFNHFNKRYPHPTGGRDPLPLRIFTATESSVLYKDIPHSWLCNGRLLLLQKPDHPNNLQLFQEQWKRGQPVMVMGVDSKLDMSLWHPNGFCSDFGDIKNDLVNCRTGVIIPNMPMKRFWLGFENFDERMKDEFGEYMLLKLKDWPPGEDFSEKLPKRFHDLMRGLPLPEYTHRDGIFNLAGRLPPWFVRPDLGPKMYNAYGSALYPTKGTTNLHLDISDAVNVMVYVGIPHDGKDEHHILEALKAIDEGGCDSLTKLRVRSKGARPGALWHIYDFRNVDKIRDLLTKVARERGEKLEAHHDPIHDQSWYLDAELRKRLYVEYGVEGYAIAQCLGDAVFIPAGAPHQVRNLHSCVKVAEDFVSPENIGHCFKLTQEFRHLSDTHTNHEDKLQIKNIIYHVVKDALSHLLVESVLKDFLAKPD